MHLIKCRNYFKTDGVLKFFIIPIRNTTISPHDISYKIANGADASVKRPFFFHNSRFKDIGNLSPRAELPDSAIALYLSVWKLIAMRNGMQKEGPLKIKLLEEKEDESSLRKN